jgi:hypothetical protein
VSERGPDIWIGLADAVPIDASRTDIGGVYAHVLALAEDGRSLGAAVDEALLEHGLRVAEIDEAEPLRNRLRTGGSVAPELLELAIDAALDGKARLGEFHAYPPDDHPDPDAFAESGAEEARSQLRVAAERRTLVSVRGHYDWYETNGYVVGLGAAWALVQLVDACGLADGFRAVSLDAVGEIEAVDPEDSLLPRILTARPLTERAPDVDLDETRRLLESAQRHADLIYLETEDMEVGAFWIGRISALDDDGVRLRSVSAEATWFDGELYPYETITRIGFGRRHEEALALAAGPDPAG